MSIEAMKQALEALEKCYGYRNHEWMKESITSLRQAIAEAEQEPDDLTIAYMSGFHDGKKKREWVGLTDDEIDQGLLRSDYALQTAHAWRAGVVFAMTQLKEKNHG